MRAERLLSQYSLANGLTLEFWDLSRPLAGDRWELVMEARLAVPVNADMLSPDLKPHTSQITAALGPEVIFSKQEIHNFVPVGEVEDLLRNLEAALFTSLGRYLSHPEFAQRFLRKKWQEYQQNLQMNRG